MKTKILFTAMLITIVAAIAYGVWDNTKPADSDPVANWPTTIRANWDALEVVFGTSLNEIDTNDIITKSPWVDIRAYGALPSATAAVNTTAINAAFAAADAGQTVFSPPGTFQINDEITVAVMDFNLRGSGYNQTIWQQTDASKDIIHPTRMVTGTVISGIQFKGGDVGIYINTNNVDERLIQVRECSFYEQATYCIETENSNSSGFTAEDCIFNLDAGDTYAVYDNQTDYTWIKNCWVSMGGNSAFYNGGGNMVITDLIGVPMVARVEDACWIENYRGLILRRCRFGAEGNYTRTILENRGSNVNSLVSIRECYMPLYNQYAFKFYEIPAILDIQDNYGYTALGGNVSQGIWIDPSATMATSNGMQNDNWQIEHTRTPLFFIGDDVTPGTATSANFSNMIALHNQDNRGDSSKSILLADFIYSALSTSADFAFTGTDMAQDTAAYAYLGGPTVERMTATADNARFKLTNTAEAGATTSAGTNYTAVWDFVLDISNPIFCKIDAENTRREFTLTNGPHVLCVPYHQGVISTHVLDIRGLADTDTVTVGRLRIFKENKLVETMYTEFTDDSGNAPTSQARLRYDLGDKQIYTDPATGSHIGEITTTAGENGGEVWKTFGSIT